MASAPVKHESHDAPRDGIMTETNGRPRYKSYRKKYRKMKTTFDSRMEEANDLFVKEHRAWETARRIKEQNDQLLDILLDMNNPTLSHGLYYELEESQLDKGFSTKKLLGTDTSSDAAAEAAAFTAIEDIAAEDLPLDLRESNGSPLPAYFTLKHEEDFLNNIDASLSAIPSTEHLPNGVEIIQPAARPREKTTITERDFVMKSEVSVRNWLRRHQPHMYDVKEEKSERDLQSPPPKSGKKGKGLKRDYVDEFDEDFDAFEPPFSKGSARKRKRADDEAYRPKGGSSRSSTANKRKREDSDARGGKKARRSGASISEDAG